MPMIDTIARQGEERGAPIGRVRIGELRTRYDLEKGQKADLKRKQRGQYLRIAVIAILAGVAIGWFATRQVAPRPEVAVAINVMPWASVDIFRVRDGQQVGTAMLTPFVTSLEIGAYRLRATHPQFKQLDLSFEVTAGRDSTVNALLPGFAPEVEAAAIFGN